MDHGCADSSPAVHGDRAAAPRGLTTPTALGSQELIILSAQPITRRVNQSASQSKQYGWKYWLGAVAIIPALFVVGIAVGSLLHAAASAMTGRHPLAGALQWREYGRGVVEVFFWPAIIVYHIVWTCLTRRAGENPKA